MSRAPRACGVVALVTVALLLASCTPVSRSYEIHTAQMTCDEANRFVHDSLLGMNMVVTAFRLGRPGSPGYVEATRTDGRGTRSGKVRITCEPSGVHIVASESGFGGEHEFERGVFLSVTARARLRVAHGKILGEEDGESGSEPLPAGVSRAADASDTVAPVAISPSFAASQPRPGGRRAAATEEVVGVVVRLEPIRGFATVLDFEADLSRAGILPIKVTVANGTRRYYEFDPNDILLRRPDSRRRAYGLVPTEAVRRLREANLAVLAEAARREAGEAGEAVDFATLDPGAASELGDVVAAARLILANKLRGGLLGPGRRMVGYLYFEVADYDRARITMVDVATGEIEGFLIEF